MAGVKTQFKLLSFFGLVPNTEQIEQQEATLLNEYNWLREMEASEKIQEYYALEKRVTSDVFTKKLEAIKSDTFEKTNEYKQLKEFEALKKSSVIKKYFKYKTNGIPERVESIAKSKSFERYQKLESNAGSGASDEEKKQQKDELDALRKDSDVKFYLKTIASSKYKTFQSTDKSKELKRYFELEEFIASKEFNEVKKEKEDTERYKKTEEYAELEKYNKQKASDDMKKFFDIKDSKKFDEIKQWELTFVDEFEGKKLDADKWINHYFWGKALLNESYSLVSDKHFPTDGKNVEINNSILKIVTKKEKVNGKVWDPRVGFYPKDFDYSSGLISTGSSFRQKFGRFEAKIKLNSNSPVIDAFWMVSDLMLPEIDVVKTDNKGKTVFANHWGPQIKSSVSKLGGTKYQNNYFIFGIEWTENKISWTINRKVVKEATQGIPTDPMYLIFSSGLNEDPQGNMLPSSMEIDWVRCYQKK